MTTSVTSLDDLLKVKESVRQKDDLYDLMVNECKSLFEADRSSIGDLHLPRKNRVTMEFL